MARHPTASLDDVLEGEPVATTTPYQVIAYTRSPATSIPINGEAAIDEVLRRYRVRWLLLPRELPPFLFRRMPSEELLNEIYRGSRTRLGSFRLEPAGRDGSFRLFRLEAGAGG